ncbi:hypothetical protein SFC42_23575 [Priestia filamentosa]
MNVEKREKELIIQWRLATIHSSLEDVIEVAEDETYVGKEKQAVHIGIRYGTTDRIVIKTMKQNDLLLITNIKYKTLSINKES